MRPKYEFYELLTTQASNIKVKLQQKSEIWESLLKIQKKHKNTPQKEYHPIFLFIFDQYFIICWESLEIASLLI